MKPHWKHIIGWHWFNIWWYRYLFAKFDDKGYCPWWQHLWCRINGHPEGPWYYNANGLEPDYHCKYCGDEI